MIARARPLLGTLVEMRCVARDAAPLEAAFAAVATVQRLMSFHDTGSELSALNRGARHEPCAVHPWTWKVLRACAELHAASRGLFDPAVAPQLVRAGLLPAPSEAWPDPQARFGDVQFLPGRRIGYRRPLWLDLGGIAKGFAVDAAIATLRARGVRTAVVNAGGDLRAMGPEPVPIVLRDPLQPARLLAAGSLRNGACATSGDYFTAGALRTPAGGAVAAGSITVLARRCLHADALTKVVALDAVAAQAALRRFGARLPHPGPS